MTRFLTIAVVVALMAASVTACGRKGAPAHPPGSSYPATYPSE